MSNNLKRALFMVWVVIVAGCSVASREEGTLSGRVTIGPLRPVLRDGEIEPTPSPEVYAAWQVVVFTEDMEREIARADIDPVGNYQLTLSVGTYVVAADSIGGGRGPGGSQAYSVEITGGRITHLDLDIDTGIR